MLILLCTVLHHFPKCTGSSSMNHSDLRKLGKKSIIQVFIQLWKRIRCHFSNQIDFRGNAHRLGPSESCCLSLISNGGFLFLMLDKFHLFCRNLGSENARAYGKHPVLIRKLGNGSHDIMHIEKSDLVSELKVFQRNSLHRPLYTLSGKGLCLLHLLFQLTANLLHFQRASSAVFALSDFLYNAVCRFLRIGKNLCRLFPCAIQDFLSAFLNALCGLSRPGFQTLHFFLILLDFQSFPLGEPLTVLQVRNQIFKMQVLFSNTASGVLNDFLT